MNLNSLLSEISIIQETFSNLDNDRIENQQEIEETSQNKNDEESITQTHQIELLKQDDLTNPKNLLYLPKEIAEISLKSSGRNYFRQGIHPIFQITVWNEKSSLFFCSKREILKQHKLNEQIEEIEWSTFDPNLLAVQTLSTIIILKVTLVLYGKNQNSLVIEPLCTLDTSNQTEKIITSFSWHPLNKMILVIW